MAQWPAVRIWMVQSELLEDSRQDWKPSRPQQQNAAFRAQALVCMVPACIPHSLGCIGASTHLLRPQTGVPQQTLWCLDSSMQCLLHVPALGLLLLCCRGAGCCMTRHSAHQETES